MFVVRVFWNRLALDLVNYLAHLDDDVMRRIAEAFVSRGEQVWRRFSVFCSNSENIGHRDFRVFQQNKTFQDLLTAPINGNFVPLAVIGQ